MKELINSIISSVPELQKRKTVITQGVGSQGQVYDWEVLDMQEQYILLGLAYRGWSPDWNQSSCIAVLSMIPNGYRIEYIEEFDYTTCVGLLNLQTSHAILIRYREYNDTVYDRYGDDDVCVIDFRTGHKNFLAPYSFDIGSYLPGELKIAINRKRNWIAFVRHEISGWSMVEQTNERIIAHIYDLTDSELIVSSQLPEITSLNSVDLPGTAQYLIVTDGSRTDHVFRISASQLHRIDSAPKRRKYQVAMSFAGKDRQLAERLANGLKQNGISVFYDQFEKSEFLGKDLYQHLFKVYSQQSEYCLVLISCYYIQSKWTLHELKAMQTTALELSEEFILPVRLDDTLLPGIPPQIGYLDYRQESIESIVEIVSRKVTKRID